MKCDCDVMDLVDEHNRGLHPLSFIRWPDDPKSAWLFCGKHRVYVPVDYTIEETL